MGPPSPCAGGTSFLKRKRTSSEDEFVDTDAARLKHTQNEAPAEAWGPPRELSEGDVGDLLFSPDSIPSSELCLGSPCDELPASDAGEIPSSDSEATVCGARQANAHPPPVPELAWADSRHVWEMLCAKDEENHHQRDACLFQRHPGLTPRMRAILLDWLIEVCEVYKLHRQTYHLCLDYIDRYLSRQRNIPKQQLQLIGITCLFIAAKVEEIYPPKIREFAYVTDGACTEEEIMDKELVILKVLQWKLGPVTALGWLNMFLQTLAHLQQQRQQQWRQRQTSRDEEGEEVDGEEVEEEEEEARWLPLRSVPTREPDQSFELPQLSGPALSAAAALLDLATLDEGSLRFPYVHLAAAALALTCGRDPTLCVSGLPWSEVSPCATWMAPFAEALHEACPTAAIGVPPPPPAPCPTSRSLRPVLDDTHNIQIHAIDLRLLERGHQLRERNRAGASPVVESPVVVAPGLLTPPASVKKVTNLAPSVTPSSSSVPSTPSSSAVSSTSMDNRPLPRHAQHAH